MSPAPVIGSYAEELYDALAPLAYADEAHGWPLRILCGAVGDVGFQEAADIADDGTGRPPFAGALDVDTCPEAWLPWLAPLVGVKLLPDLDEAGKRRQIKGEGRWHRGTVDSIRAAVQRTLTGTKTVTILERTTSAYAYTVRTLAAETPDPAAAEYDATVSKPAGLMMTFEVV